MNPARRGLRSFVFVSAVIVAGLPPAIVVATERGGAGPGADCAPGPATGKWLFPAEEESRGGDHLKPENARRLIRGQKLDYGVWVDRSKWKPSWWEPEKGDLIFVPAGGGDWGAYTVATAKSLTVQKVTDLFLE